MDAWTGTAADESWQRIGSIPKQRTNYFRKTYEFPDDFPERLKRFQKESGLSWSEIARRIGTYRHTVSRWKEGLSRPNTEHMMALLELAEGPEPHRRMSPRAWRPA